MESAKKDIFFYIVVPIYNVKDYLPKCLESIAAQSCQNFHCILVNDGSTDGSLKVAQDFVAKHEESSRTKSATSSLSLSLSRLQFSIIDKPNGGLSSARNAGFDKACELAKIEILNFLWFVDSDDWVAPDALEIVKNAINKNPDIDYFCSNFVDFYDEKSKKINHKKEYYFPKEFEDGAINPLQVLDALNSAKFMRFYSSWNHCFNLEFLRKNNIRHIEHIIFEDVPFVLECRIKAKSVYVSSKCIYTYRDGRRGSIMDSALQLRSTIQRGTLANHAKTLNSYYAIMLEYDKARNLDFVPKNLQSLFGQALLRDLVQLLRMLQFIGYRRELCFSKNDLYKFYNDLPIRYKICYHIPRIYGFPKKTRLFFKHLIFRNRR